LPSRLLRAGIALVAAQPALLFGYALWGGIKELAAAALIPAAAAALPPAVDRPQARAAIPLGVVVGALLGMLSLGGAVWLAVLVGLGFAVRARAWSLPAYAATLLVGAAAIVLAGSPWVGAKALATASPAPVFLALVACAVAAGAGRRVEAAVAAAAIVGGIAW